MTVIVDYGVGNIRAIANMLSYLGETSVCSDRPEVIGEAKRIILPGVGAFDTAMQELDRRGLREVLAQKALQDKTPLLGICLGMQLLTNGSEEGGEKGLGWIPGFSYRFPRVPGLKVPHMRWNSGNPVGSSSLFRGMPDESRFYFVHSYYVRTEAPEHTVLLCSYGLPFAAAIQKDNIMGVQFHPERSHKFGLGLFSNFIQLS